MPCSLHRILIHGTDIIKASLPIEMFSEEALESRNKELRKYRECNTRKFSREETIQDLFNALLITSDPPNSSLSQCIGTHSYKEPLNKDVIQLLQEPQLQGNLLLACEEEDDFDDED